MSLPEFKTMLAEALRRIEGRLLPQGATEGQALLHGSVRPYWGSVTPPDGSITEAKIDDGAVTLAKLAAAVQASLMPAGAVSGTAGTTAPTGWLMCDGSAVSTTTYAALYAAIGTTYDTQRNQSTGANYSAPSAGTFRVPDYRGVFLRGVGTSSGYAATTLGTTQDDATAKNGLTATASASGVTGSVGGSDGTHAHNEIRAIVRGHSGSSQNEYHPSNNGSWISMPNSVIGGAGSGHGHSHSLTAGAQTITVGAGDSETRPVNVGINWMIKV